MARSLKPYGPGTAKFSSCGTWRYELTRDLTKYPRPADKYPPRGVLVSIGLNPSTATGEDDDPTIHKESYFAIQWGYAIYLKVNAYGFRATDPNNMFAARDRGIDIVGPGNDRAIRDAIKFSLAPRRGRVLVAWGGNIEPERQRAIGKMLSDAGVQAVCIKVNKDKHKTPFHPLYARNDVVPVPWICP